MKRYLLLLASLAATVHLAAQSRIESFSVKSEILGSEKTCSVYLPEGYDSSNKSYPVLYLLHGASDTHTAWAVKGNMRQITDQAIAAGTALPMIVVMPDASGESPNHTGRHMGYFDVPGWEYERFFFAEFMPAVEKHYRILADKSHRALAGLSMGGGGSVVYAQRHPELFGSSCPISGVLDATSLGDGPADPFRVSLAETSPVKFLQTLTDAQATALRTVRWRVDCGDDDFLYQSNIRFYELMRQHQIPIEYRMRDGGHTWHYWQASLPEILSFISVGFAQ